MHLTILKKSEDSFQNTTTNSTLLLPYESLISQPDDAIREVLHLIAPEHDVDAEHLAREAVRNLSANIGGSGAGLEDLEEEPVAHHGERITRCEQGERSLGRVRRDDEQIVGRAGAADYRARVEVEADGCLAAAPAEFIEALCNTGM